MKLPFRLAARSRARLKSVAVAVFSHSTGGTWHWPAVLLRSYRSRANLPLAANFSFCRSSSEELAFHLRIPRSIVLGTVSFGGALDRECSAPPSSGAALSVGLGGSSATGGMADVGPSAGKGRGRRGLGSTLLGAVQPSEPVPSLASRDPLQLRRCPALLFSHLSSFSTSSTAASSTSIASTICSSISTSSTVAVSFPLACPTRPRFAAPPIPSPRDPDLIRLVVVHRTHAVEPRLPEQHIKCAPALEDLEPARCTHSADAHFAPPSPVWPNLSSARDTEPRPRWHKRAEAVPVSFPPLKRNAIPHRAVVHLGGYTHDGTIGTEELRPLAEGWYCLLIRRIQAEDRRGQGCPISSRVLLLRWNVEYW
ncbi:hypothetical protein B0H10DRAFT_2228792 [Mycena sp. CBHHK59/15]|nr:hypothetical protein B0H10DRAFT_2228792 [Mycena sp. CBHHK59/15]